MGEIERNVNTSGFTTNDYDNILKSQSYNVEMSNIVKSKEQKQKEQKAFNKKIEYFQNVLKRVENSVNSVLKRAGLSINNLKLDKTYSSGNSDREIVTRLNYWKDSSNEKNTVGVVNMNLNIKKLLNYPSLELYTLLYSSVLKSALSKSDMDKVEDVIRKDGAVLNKLSDATSKLTAEQRRQMAQKIISRYASEFLNNKYEGGVGKERCEIIASAIMNGLTDEEIVKLINHNFSKSNLKKEIRDAYIEESRLMDKRLTSIHERLVEKGISFEGYGVDPMGYNKLQQQEQALSNVALSDKFRQAKSGMLSGNNQAMKEYCEAFTKNFCSAYGVPAVQIQFVNLPKENYMGEFNDLGQKGQFIKVNLARVDSIIDLSTTLSHELTHASESMINKSKGMVTKNKMGLLNDMSEDISNSGFMKGSMEQELLKEINNYCYVVNPNEISARQSELSAYSFMIQFADSDERLKNQLLESIEGRTNPKTGQKQGGYIAYLQKTQSYLENIDQNIEKFINRFNSLDVPKGTEGYNEIKDRIEYLKVIKANYNDIKKVKDVIEFVPKVVSTIKNGRDVNKNKNMASTNQVENESQNDTKEQDETRKKKNANDAKKAIEIMKDEELINEK